MSHMPRIPRPGCPDLKWALTFARMLADTDHGKIVTREVQDWTYRNAINAERILRAEGYLLQANICADHVAAVNSDRELMALANRCAAARPYEARIRRLFGGRP